MIYLDIFDFTDPINLVGLGFLILISIGLQYFILRWIFSVDQKLKNQRRQNKLLEIIARKSGASQQEIDK